MKITLSFPDNYRYIRINPKTKLVHVLVPFIAGQDISTDNTCQSTVELKDFFEGGAYKELMTYKKTLAFYSSLLEDNPLGRDIDRRCFEVFSYSVAVQAMEENHMLAVENLLKKPSNLYSIQLRPQDQDSYSKVFNPVFTVNRSNDDRGTPLSPLFNKMHEIFPGLILGKSDPYNDLINRVSRALPKDASFEIIQNMLAIECRVPEDFFKSYTDNDRVKHVVNKDYIDTLMAYDENTPPRDYITALLGLCAPNLQSMLPGSPFYQEVSSNPKDKAEHLSILTQFFLGVLNVFCRAQGLSDKNFGEILDNAPDLSQGLVKVVAEALTAGDEAEHAIIKFFNTHKEKNAFNLSRDLSLTGPDNHKDAIQQKFETTYRTVTATKENPHMDDFMILDTQACGEKDIFISSHGLICTDFSNILPDDTLGFETKQIPNKRIDARMHQSFITPKEEPAITIDISLDTFMNKLNKFLDYNTWNDIPTNFTDTYVLPLKFLDDVAKGKLDEVYAILEISADIQSLFNTPGKFTDYSERAFDCTPYEYAYWAKDTDMCRMLEANMDEDTKQLMLEKIDRIERLGLAYQQHGVSYQNPHYDMSFVLKDLSLDEFHRLQAILGQHNPKMQGADANNYQTIHFTATEYEALKHELAQQKIRSFMPFCSAYFQFLFYLAYPICLIISLFISSPAETLIKQLKFDFHSLITALDTYVTHYDKQSYDEKKIAWMSVGQAQRDMPAHIAHAYWNTERPFFPLPLFHETTRYQSTRPRKLSFEYPGLGSYFVLVRGLSGTCGGLGRKLVPPSPAVTAYDLAAIRHLDEVSIADLRHSRDNLSPPYSQIESLD